MERASAHLRSAAALGGVIHAREPGVVSCSRPGCLVSRPAASQHWRSGIPYAIWRVTVERTTHVHPRANVAGPRRASLRAAVSCVGGMRSSSATILQQYSLVELPL